MAKKSEMSAAEKYREERKARLAKAAKKNSKKSHRIQLPKPVKSAIAVIVVLAIIGGIGVYAYENSATKQQKIMAVQYMDTQISKPVYSYYYNSIFSNTFSTARYYDNYGSGYGQMYTGYDYTTSPDEQAYPYADEMEGYENPTWSDYFDYSTRETIKQIETFCNLAAELGIELDEEHQQELDENMDTLAGYAEESNSSVNSYLRTYYGLGVTKNLVKDLMAKQLLAQMYMEHMQDGYKAEYTDEEVEKHYEDNLEQYAIVSLRHYSFNADKVSVEKTAEDGTVTPTEETTDETMAAALEKANAFAAACKDDASFKKLASEAYKSIDPDGYTDYLTDDSKTLYDGLTHSGLEESAVSEETIEWAFSAAAKKGTTHVEKVDGTGYNVYMVSVPAGKDMTNDKTYDVRHILIKFKEEEETPTEATTEATTEAATQAEAETTAAEQGEETATVADTTAAAETTAEPTEPATTEASVTTIDTSAYGDTVVDLWADADNATDKVAYKEAQDILLQFLEGDKSEESFAALATKYSEDHQEGEEVVDGGLYENVAQKQMVAPFEDWSLDEARKAGDVGIVETSYGYHIMYSVGVTDNGVAWKFNAMNDMANEDFTEYSDELLADEKYAVTDIDAEAVAAVRAENIDLAKRQIYSLQNQQSAAY